MTIPPEMVERVARAIQKVTPEGYGLNTPEAEVFARAAIEAMREPTRDMATKGRHILCGVADRMETAKLTASSQIDFWQQVGHRPADEIYAAMIDAALGKEGGE